MQARTYSLRIIMVVAFLVHAPVRSARAADWKEELELTAQADGKQYDSFGWSVAVSGQTAIVGATDDDFANLRQGAAYVFVRSGGTWSRQARLTASDGDESHRNLFGWSVAISGDTAIVGALPTNTNARGAAYVFVRKDSTWTEQQILSPFLPASGDECGFSVAISGDTAVLGCKNNSQGSAYVFVRSGTTWSAQQKLTAVNSTAGDFFAWSVGLSGDTAIIGAFADKLGGAQAKGSATVFARSGTTWSFQQKLTAADGMSADGFGQSVGISGDSAIVGQVGGDPSQPLRQAAYVFVRSGTTWSQQKKLEGGDTQSNDKFGGSVAINGDRALVGASGDDVAAAGTDEGSAYLFVRSGTTWSQSDKLTASDHGVGDIFGYRVALGSSLAVVGAPSRKIGANLYQGAAYPFFNPDTDGDGLADDWETNGVTIGGVTIDLPKMGANPRHKDIFVHADWMEPNPLQPVQILYPEPRVMKTVIDAFAVAPVTNPDGKPGINLHVDLGSDSIMNPVTGAKWGALSRANSVPFQANLGTSTNGDYNWTQFDAIKAMFYKPAKRDAVFRYTVICNRIAGSLTSGKARDIPGTDFVLGFGISELQGASNATLLPRAGTFMHELGHTLGLNHGGDVGTNYKPNYLSIMNYAFQITGVLSSATKQRKIDYSRATLPNLDETNLVEANGIADPAQHVTLWSVYTRGNNPAGSNKCLANPNTYNTKLPSPALDWDCDGALTANATAADINGDGICVSPKSTPVLQTFPPSGDDDIRNQRVISGPNRRCETAASAGDQQESSVGYEEPVILNGFTDWSHLDYSGDNRLGNLAGKPETATTPEDEVPAERIVGNVPPGLLDEQAAAPLDVATLSADQGPAPLLVSFDGSTSTAFGATITEWAWDFGDGTTGAGAMTQHTYDTPGEYFASLTVTDSNGHVNLVPLLNLVTVSEGGPGPTPTPTPGVPLSLDHFVLYATAPTKGTAKFAKFGPLTLAGAFTTGGFDVQKPAGLAIPADTNGGGFVDATTNLSAYAIKPAKGAAKPGPHPNVRVANACGETVVTLAKPVMLLVPSALDPNAPATAPNAPDLDHFLCYQAKPQKKDGAGAAVAPFPKGVQVDAIDQFETKRFDLKKIVALCAPVGKSGTPFVLSGPTKGTLLPITPAAVRNPGSHLVCYQAALAKKHIAQSECGPATPGDKGTAIAPPQAKHVAHVGLHVADQLGSRQLDSKKASLLCFPSTLPSP